MKLFLKIMVAILVIGLLMPFTLIKGRDGNPLLGFSDLKWPEFSRSVPDSGDESLAGKYVIYNWTDAEGNLQFSNTQPPAGVEYTVKGYDPNVNVIQAVEINAEEAKEKVEIEPKKEASDANDPGNPYTLKKIEKLFEDTDNIQNMLNQRLNKQMVEIDQNN